MLALLPLNYLLEFGFFLVAGLLYFKAAWFRSDPPARKRLIPDLFLLLTSFFICTFIKSTVIDNNDIGWRGFYAGAVHPVGLVCEHPARSVYAPPRQSKIPFSSNTSRHVENSFPCWTISIGVVRYRLRSSLSALFLCN